MRAGWDLAGRYRMVRCLGRGGFGEVWAAQDALHDRLVAIKFLRSEISVADGVLLGKFRQEAQIGARLNHPGIIAVDDFGADNDQWYLVMEYLDGRDLKSELADYPGGMPVSQVLALGAQIAGALAAAHDHGIVHRDMKPANVMLGNGQTKIGDFGIAHLAEASAFGTLSGQVVGTPEYMAPEQWLGQRVDHRTDLYAFGGILYALITGSAPFSGPRAVVRAHHVDTVPLRVGQLRPEVPADLEDLVARLLAKKPEDRPSWAEVIGCLRPLGLGTTADDGRPVSSTVGDRAGLRTLYLRRAPRLLGRDSLAGRKLFDRLAELSDARLLAHAVLGDEAAAKVLNPDLNGDLVSETAVRAFAPNLIYVEDGLFLKDSEWRVREPYAREFVRSGGVMIIADVDINDARERRDAYRAAYDFLGTGIDYGHEDRDPVYASDTSHCWKSDRQIVVNPSRMVFDSWLSPVYENISELVVGHPLKLTGPRHHILATGNEGTTGTLIRDVWQNENDFCVFGTVHMYGDGYVAFIAGNVSADVWVERCPDNVEWLVRLGALLVEDAAAERQRNR